MTKTPLNRWDFEFRQCFNEKPNIFSELEGSLFKVVDRFGISNFGHCDLFVIWDFESPNYRAQFLLNHHMSYTGIRNVPIRPV